MRVNVYAEELTDRIEVIKKPVNQETFYGIRLYLKSHPDLHHSIDDNDESAITIWVPWTKKTGNDFGAVIDLLRLAERQLAKAQLSALAKGERAS